MRVVEDRKLIFESIFGEGVNANTKTPEFSFEFLKIRLRVSFMFLLA